MAFDYQTNSERRLYHDLAWIWPIISPPADYRDEAEEFRALIHAHGPAAPETVLHLGCGAGHLDTHLKQHFKMIGIDLSAPMLALARSNNPKIPYIQGDFQSIQLGTTFDAVILADASDYLLTPEALGRTCANAYRHLRPGGVFCTYAEEIAERFAQNKTRTAAHTRGEIDITAIENVYDPDPTDTTYELTLVYLIRKDGKLQVELDRHLAGLFTTPIWIQHLEAAGFEVRVIPYADSGPMFIGRK